MNWGRGFKMAIKKSELVKERKEILKILGEKSYNDDGIKLLLKYRLNKINEYLFGEK